MHNGGKKGRRGGNLPQAISDGLDTTAIFAGVFCLAAVLYVLMTCGEYPERLADNKVLVVPALGLAASGGILYFCFSGKERRCFRHPVIWLFLGYCLLFAAQFFWVSRVYFYTGWDVGLMKFRVEGIVNGGSMASVSADAGYSIYPNNLCIYISCFCVNLSCFLGNLIIRKLTDSGVLR